MNKTAQEDITNWRTRLRRTSAKSPNEESSPDLEGVSDELRKKLIMRRNSSVSSSSEVDNDSNMLSVKSKPKKRPSDSGCGTDVDEMETSPASTKRPRLSPKKSRPVSELASLFNQKSSADSNGTPLPTPPFTPAGDKVTGTSEDTNSKQESFKEKLAKSLQMERQSSDKGLLQSTKITPSFDFISETSSDVSIDSSLRSFSRSRRNVIPVRRKRGSQNPVKKLQRRKDIRDSI